MSYSQFLELRDEEAYSIKPWTWIKVDRGAWDGPKSDWETSHCTKYFQYLRGHDTVVTAGANQGMYARFYVDRFRVVYAFEPDALNFHCLVNNTQFDNVIKIQGALGDRHAFIDLNRHNKENCGSYTIKQPYEGNIPMFTLDSFKLPNLDLLQLDVEGHEIFAIRGARETIEKHRPVIILENGNGTDIQQFMKELNYEHIDQSISDAVWKPINV